MNNEIKVSELSQSIYDEETIRLATEIASLLKGKTIDDIQKTLGAVKDLIYHNSIFL